MLNDCAVLALIELYVVLWVLIPPAKKFVKSAPATLNVARTRVTELGCVHVGAVSDELAHFLKATAAPAQKITLSCVVHPAVVQVNVPVETLPGSTHNTDTRYSSVACVGVTVAVVLDAVESKNSMVEG